MAKTRLDLLLVERNFFDSRKKAQTAIMAGLVKVNGQKVDKAGTLFKEDIKIDVEAGQKFVSRGGLKLEKALAEFKPVIKNRIFLDIGASTGGFTDCLLKNGAAYVYAIDVGYGQFDWQLRNDPKVRVLEKCNARYLSREELYIKPNLEANAAVIDVSFISLTLIVPNIIKLMPEDFYIIALVKPQFEAGKERVKKGVVTDPKTHLEVLISLKDFLKSLNLVITQVTYSPVKGPSGNREFLIYISSAPTEEGLEEQDFEKCVEHAHRNL